MSCSTLHEDLKYAASTKGQSKDISTQLVINVKDTHQLKLTPNSNQQRLSFIRKRTGICIFVLVAGVCGCWCGEGREGAGSEGDARKEVARERMEGGRVGGGG